MNNHQREQLRISVMRYCESAAQFRLSAGLLLQFVRNEGFRSLTSTQLNTEIRYLTDKAFLAAVEKPISPENEAWRITAAGRDYLAQQLLDQP